MVLYDRYLEGVCWDYDPRRLAGSQRNLNNSSFQQISYFVFVSTYTKTNTYICTIVFVSSSACILHLIQSAVDEWFMVGWGGLLGRHPRCETACWTAQPMLGSRWGDQLVRLSSRFNMIAIFTPTKVKRH